MSETGNTEPPASTGFSEAFPPELREKLAGLPREERVRALADAFGREEDEILDDLARRSGIDRATVDEFDLEMLRKIPARLIHEFKCLPLKNGDDEGRLLLATVYPPEPHMNDWVYAVTGRETEWRLAPQDKIQKVIVEHLGVGADSLERSEMNSLLVEETTVEDEDENAALIRFVNDVIHQAVVDGATDIHFEPQENHLRIRYRIDGLLVNVPVPDNLRRFQEAIISRLKIMARLNISERRLPQDGRIDYKVGDNALDIRISTISTMYGESVSLRLLNKKNQALTFAELGLAAKEEDRIRHILGFPHGIVLVTGPTGSGKSTSLNAFIREINSTDKRIITIEDPIEYEVPGANQMQVRNEIGFGFAEALRHVLRQDPDVIMVGEIRDRDTADIAIRASLTGHLVFSTLHTNDSAGALIRLTDMGLEPFLIASAVELIIAQRLVRRLCPHCKKLDEVTPERLRYLTAPLQLDEGALDGVEAVMQATGCEQCRELGYRGRIGIFEVLRVDESLHDSIVNRESVRAIRKIAMQRGMKPLQQAGWEKVKAGETTLDEILRVASFDTIG